MDAKKSQIIRTTMNDRHQQKPYPLRISTELRDMLEGAAGVNGRSLNAEITARLQESFDPKPSLPNENLASLSSKVSALEALLLDPSSEIEARASLLAEMVLEKLRPAVLDALSKDPAVEANLKKLADSQVTPGKTSKKPRKSS
ncbi:Arc family DNA-binding protein [Ralstonia insidiosa]|uniref:Arc family DNA-binding protein n=1 Tax=Ralstonia insidiosa TaxID=190721 RepID=UPI00200AA952|nr:Arc family DNA-binding protein [Ralstonia insidiosa]MCK8648886.1 Arc family DNA-binding protein [Ralstonia insidiosa]